MRFYEIRLIYYYTLYSQMCNAFDKYSQIFPRLMNRLTLITSTLVGYPKKQKITGNSPKTVLQNMVFPQFNNLIPISFTHICNLCVYMPLNFSILVKNAFHSLVHKSVAHKFCLNTEYFISKT